MERTSYVSPRIEVIETEYEGVLAASLRVGQSGLTDFGSGGGNWTPGGTPPPMRNRFDVDELENTISDLFTIDF